MQSIALSPASAPSRALSWPLPLTTKEPAAPPNDAKLLDLMKGAEARRLASALVALGAPNHLAAQVPTPNDSVLSRLTAEALVANPGLVASRAMARAAA